MEHSAQNQEQKSLPFFGIPRLFPYLKKYRKTLSWMIVCGLLASGVDILMPVMQRYALNHFIAEKTLDTLPWYILGYVVLIVFASCMNFISCNGMIQSKNQFMQQYVTGMKYTVDILVQKSGEPVVMIPHRNLYTGQGDLYGIQIVKEEAIIDAFKHFKMID